MTKLFMQIAVLLIVGVLCLPAVPSADQAQYFYDELGRLVGVVDGSGNAAIYVFDEVGNLLRIDRFTTGTSGIAIFLVAPSSGLVGANVEVKGFGFDPTPANNQVKFNSTTAAVVSASATSIIATVPTGATTGSVTVTNANGTATSPQAFTVLVPPIISGVDPVKVAQGTSQRVVIEGFNLNTATAVTFAQSGLGATILSDVTAQSLPITLTVGAAVPPGLYPFSVVSPGGTAQSGTVKVEVTTAVPSFNITKGSILRSGPPAGANFSLAKGSVLRP